MAVSYTAISAPAVTNLNSLADATYWASATYVNSTNLSFEVDVFITILTTTTAGADGSVDIWVAPSVDGVCNMYDPPRLGTGGAKQQLV